MMSKNTAQAYSTWQDQEKAERDRILLEQLPQVRYLARRIHERLPRQVPLEDLVHAGVIGSDRCSQQIRSVEACAIRIVCQVPHPGSDPRQPAGNGLGTARIAAQGAGN